VLPFIALPFIKFESDDNNEDVQTVPPDGLHNTAIDDGGKLQPRKRTFRKANFMRSILPYHTAPVVKFCYHTVCEQ